MGFAKTNFIIASSRSREAEIANFDVEFVIKKDILGFEVTMDDPTTV